MENQFAGAGRKRGFYGDLVYPARLRVTATETGSKDCNGGEREMSFSI